MLLSYRAASNASSSYPEHPASEAFDEDVQSYWAAGSSGPAFRRFSNFLKKRSWWSYTLLLPK